MIKLVSINLIIIAAGLLLVELVFGGWLSSKPLEHLNVLRNVQYSMKTDELYDSEQKIAVYVRDAYGLRGRHHDPSKIDLLTIGGSTTDQRYLTEGETWQDYLEKLLKESGKEFEITNAGLDGLSTTGEIEAFTVWFPQIPDLKPKHVLLYNGINEIFSGGTSSYDDVVGNKTFKGAIRSKSALYDLYQKVQGLIAARFSYPVSHRAVQFDLIDWTNVSVQHNHQELLKQKISIYEKNLNHLKDKIEKIDARPIFVTQPSAMFRRQEGQIVGVSERMTYHGNEINGVDFYHMLSLINAKTMEFCNNVDGICLDLANEVRFEVADFYDYFHNTPRGAKKIADYLFHQLKREL